MLWDAAGDAERHITHAGYSFIELRDLLAASVETGSPLVAFCNGMSFGFAPWPSRREIVERQVAELVSGHR